MRKGISMTASMMLVKKADADPISLPIVMTLFNASVVRIVTYSHFFVLARRSQHSANPFLLEQSTKLVHNVSYDTDRLSMDLCHGTSQTRKCIY